MLKQLRVWLCAVCAIILLFSSGVSAMASTDVPQTSADDPFAIIKSKVDANLSPWKEAYDVLMKDANDGLLVQSQAIPIWEVPPFYGNPDGHKAAKISLESNTQAAYAGAVAYRLNGDTRYADKAVELLNSWAAINTGIGEQDAPLASAYIGVGMINAANLLKDYPGWSSQEQAQFQSWIERVWLAVWTARIDRNDNNNWGDWMRYAMLSYYNYTDNDSAFTAQTNGLKHKIDEAIDADGFMPSEMRGPNTMWYHFFALSPMTAAAELVLQRTGENLFHWQSDSGASLKKAVDTLFYYSNGRVAQWPADKGGAQTYKKFFDGNYFPLNMYEAMAGIYQDEHFEKYVSPYRSIGGNLNDDTGFYHNQAWVYPTLLRPSFIDFPDPGYVKIEAENFTGREKVDYRATSDEGGGYALFSTDNGDYVWYDYVFFGSGANYFDIRYASTSTDGAISIRTGSPTGPEIGYIQIPSTGGLNNYATIRVPLTGAKGYKNVFFTFIKPTAGTVADINWFSYSTDDNNVPVPSPNANLESLSVNGEPVAGFNSLQLTYNVTIPANASSLPIVAAAPADGNATLHIEQATAVPGVATVTVTAENGTTKKTYSIWYTQGEATDSRSIRIEAESFTGQSGLAVGDINVGTELIRKLGSTDNNDYAYYNDLNFGSGVSSMVVRYTTPYTDSRIEIRDGGVTGPLLGSASLPKTGGWVNYETTAIEFRNANNEPIEVGGIRNIYVVFKRAGGSAVGDFDWFSYNPKLAANAANNQLSVLPDATAPGNGVTLTAAGDRQFDTGAVYGDERYIPASWSSSEGAGMTGAFTLNGGHYSSVYTPASAGHYEVTGLFRQDMWNGSAWVSTGATVSQTVQVQVTVGTAEEARAVLTADAAQRYPGQAVELTIGVEHASPSFTALDVIVDYDPEALEFSAIEEDGIFWLTDESIESLNPHFSATAVIRTDTGRIRIILAAANNEHAVSGTTSLIKLSGIVKDNATVGDNTKVSLARLQVSSASSSAEFDTSTTEVAIEITASVETADKSALSTIIEEAETVRQNAVVGTSPGNYPASAKTALELAIQSAIEVRNQTGVNQSSVDSAAAALNAALAQFAASVITAGPTANMTALSNKISQIEALLQKAQPGTKIGQYPALAVASLEQALLSAKNVRASGTSNQGEVDAATAALDAASQTFSASLITIVEGSSQITIRDLSILVQYFGITSGHADWSKVAAADIDNRGEITIEALAAVARMILTGWTDHE